MSIINLSLLFALFTSLLLSWLLYSKKNKHKLNIQTANRIIAKLNTIEHNGQKISYLRKIDPFVFEELLLTSYKKKGYKIKRNKRYTGDGGIDGIIFDSKGNKILIQAKRYSSYINPKHLHSFSELIYSQKAFKGFFIHTGKTSISTRSLYNSNTSTLNIISGNQLLRLICDN